jgi:hypothetical protein
VGLKGQGFELILCWFSIVGLVYVVWNRPKKAKCKPKWQVFLIAHNYKKCGKTVLVINKINGLGRSEIKKSAVRFEFVNVLDCVQRSETLPPRKGIGRQKILVTYFYL